MENGLSKVATVATFGLAFVTVKDVTKNDIFWYTKGSGVLQFLASLFPYSLRSLSSSVGSQMSNLVIDSMLALGILGFKMDVFVRDALDDPHSWTNSEYFPHPDKEQVAEIERYAEAKGYRVLLKYDVTGSFLQILCKVHCSPFQYLNHVICTNNIQRSMHPIYPVQILGSADLNINKMTCQPDLQAQVANRTHPSPNLVVETHYRNGHSDAQFHARLLTYITGTLGVMIVVGFRIFERNKQGSFEALVIVYERTADNLPACAYSVSFGTAEISPARATSWTNGAQVALTAVTPGIMVPPLVGAGMGSPPCTQAPTGGATPSPYLITLRQDLMLCTNFNVPYMFSPDNPSSIVGQDFDVDLYYIQFAIDKVL